MKFDAVNYWSWIDVLKCEIVPALFSAFVFIKYVMVKWKKSKEQYKEESYPLFSNPPVNIIENKKKAGNNSKIKEIQKWTIK